MTLKRKRQSGLLQLTIVGMILAVIAVSFGINVLSAGTPPGVPAKLAEMKLGNYIEGSQALTQVNQLHGTQIDLTDAYIAEYSHDFNPYHNDNSRVTVWVGTARSNEAAANLLARMVAGLGDGNTVFSNLERLTIAGYEVYQVSGTGGEHFFYQSRKSPDKVIWLTITQAGNTLSIVEQAINEF